MKAINTLPAFVLAGTNSGCGKTTTTLALLALLQKRGLTVQAFKSGPDYIDPAFHGKLLGRPSYNIDTQMLSAATCKHLFNKHSAHADVAVVEGVMGLYDGMGPKANGSTAEVAKTLQLPVVLVVNASGMYQSVAALVQGFANYDPDLRIAGVLLNHVGNPMVYSAMQQMIENTTGIPCLGYLPKVKGAELESRHLGLIQAQELDTFQEKIDLLTNVFSTSIDIDKLLEVTLPTHQLPAPTFKTDAWHCQLNGLHLAIAHDKAFSFYYHDNLELLQKMGATLHYFSPLTDTQLPEACNAVYFGGGYPEVFAETLSANTSMLKSIKKAAETNMPIYAECGGLMYLCDSLTNLEAKSYNMAGVFSAKANMTKALKRFGYCSVKYAGVQSMAHEFHRSELTENEHANYTHQYQVQKPIGDKTWTCGLRHKNVLAAYAHIHFYSSANFFQKIIELWTQHT